MLVEGRNLLKRIVSGFVLTLLLIGALTFAFNGANGITDHSTARTMCEDFKSGDFALHSDVDWWPMFHHDLSRAGFSTSTAPNTNNTVWNVTTDNSVYSSPAVANGMVYATSFDGNVYCVDALTGNEAWSEPSWIGTYSYSSPAVADGKVYAGTLSGNVYCLNASTGDIIWNYLTGKSVFSCPAIADGKVYVGSNDKNVYCLSASTGAKIWNYTTDNVVWSSPAVVDGKVYVGSSDNRVYCLDALTGEPIWNYK
jgi:outer membrane protein assembly factor BamB